MQDIKGSMEVLKCSRMKATFIKQKKSVERLPRMQTAPGNLGNGVGAGRHITEPKRAEEALRDSPDELKRQVAGCKTELAQAKLLMDALLNHVPDRIYFKDTQSRFTKCNLALAERLGLKNPNQVIGKTDFDFHPAERAREFFQDEQRIIQGGASIINKVEQQTRANGEIIWASVSKAQLRDEKGKIVGLVGINRDITDYKRAELALTNERALLRTLIDNLPDTVYAKDTAGRKTLANPADLKTLRCKTEAEAIGKSDFDFFPPEVAKKFHDDDQKVIHGEPVINREEYFFDEAGQKCWLLTSKLPLRDQHGTIVGLIGIGRDITAIKKAEAKLDQTHKQLLETSRQAGMAEVAASVLHNVGNVLNSVNVASSCVADSLRNSKAANLSKIVALLREHEADLGHFITNDPKGKQLPGYLAQLAEHLADEQTVALDKLARLQKNIEHISEIVATQQNYAKTSDVLESLPIVELVEDAVRMNVGSMERHNIKMLREYSETPLVLADKHKVLQILVNLISNAKHACTDSEKVDKQIILRVAHDNERIKISVIDNGVGIPAENMTLIFNHGFTTKKNGHGFGLHSGALAAKEMGGSLAAFSEGPARGATFTLALPIQGQKANL
jgi:PAS domain S-box-containing protein